MVGYPKHLNTREDYDFVVANFSKEEYLRDFQDLLDSRYDYKFDHYLEENESVDIMNPIYKIVMESTDNPNQLPKRALYVKTDVEGNRMEQLGYTEEEVLAIING